MSIDLPRSIKIGPIMYVLRRVKKIDGNWRTWGQIDYHKAIIKLKGGLSVQHQAVSVIHEVFHGLFVAAGRKDLSDDETLVDWLAENLVDTLWNSPGLLRYLRETNRS